MKDTICLIAGIVGGFIATLLGGWDSALATLIVFMGIDFVTGIVTAAMGKSKHSESGTLNNTTLIGIPFPPAFKKAIDVLQTKVGRTEEEKEDE